MPAELWVDSLNECDRLVLPPLHFSNISSNVLMRSSMLGLPVVPSESLDDELIDGGLDGLAGSLIFIPPIGDEEDDVDATIFAW